VKDPLQTINLSQEAFNKGLDECLTILTYPEKSKPFYICEYVSFSLHVKKIKVYINN
jgi:hypothetical protein